MFAASGCSSITLEENNPSSVNLTGNWFLNIDSSDQVEAFRNRSGEDVIRSGRAGFAFVAHDFQVLRAEQMQVDLNADSMGIRYTPGVYRDVTWGKRDRGVWKVHAGWEDRQLLVLSSTRGIDVTERFTLITPQQLVVQVDVSAEGEQRSYRRVFDRGPR